VLNSVVAVVVAAAACPLMAKVHHP
jgi:hypothetical protein